MEFYFLLELVDAVIKVAAVEKKVGGRFFHVLARITNVVKKWRIHQKKVLKVQVTSLEIHEIVQITV
jgi:hypothetical protein